MTIKGVFFDFWGTLCVMDDMTGELDEWISALHKVLSDSGATTTKAAVWNYYDERMFRENLARPDNGMSVFERRIQNTGVDFGVNLTRSEINHAAILLLAVWDKYAFVDRNCVPVLGVLRQQQKVTGLISNFDHPAHVHEIVRNTGMGKFFQTVIVSGDHDVKKPDPAIFQMALAKTGLQPGDCMYVGDSEEDITGANNAGMVSVLIDRSNRGNDFGQKATVRSLQEVLALKI
jgi:putative hydrolase of the HAD superfamily